MRREKPCPQDRIRRIFEDGIEQPITLFSAEAFPLSAAILIDNDRQPHPNVFRQSIGDENTVQNLLAGGAVNLQKTGVACRKHVIVVRFQGDGRGKSPGNVHQDKRRAPAGDIVYHFHGIEQSLDVALNTRTPEAEAAPAAVTIECSDSRVTMRPVISLISIHSAMVSMISVCGVIGKAGI